MELGYYWRIFLRRLPWILFFAVIGSAIGIYFALTMPPVYKSSARMIVESEQIPDELAASTVRTGATEQISIIEQRILTREVLIEMANRLNIFTSPEQRQMTASDKVADLRDRISIGLSGGGRSARAMLVNVSFRDEDAQRAARVTNEIVTLILQENVQMRTTVSGQTLEFFTQEVDRLGQEMSRLSARMLAFQEENLEALPDSLDFRRSRQVSVQERLAQLDRDERALTDRRDRLTELYENTGDVPLEDTEAATAEARQLAQLRRDYANSRAILAENNPRLGVMRARIAVLEQTVAEQQATAASGSVSQGGIAPPSPYEIQVADIDAQLATISVRRDELQSQLDALTASIGQTPGNTVTLQAMQRDYANLQAQYNQAVSNQARAETGDMIEALSKGQRISLVEQAIAPNAPDSPNRKALAGAGMMGGLAVGVALVVLFELLNDTVRRPVEISARLGISALATVPYIRTNAETRHKRTLRAGTGLAVLLLIAGGLWVVDNQVIPLDQAAARARAALGALL